VTEPCIVLISERSDLAADLLVVALRARGRPFVRWNRDEFPARAAVSWSSDGSGHLYLGDQAWPLKNIASAWCRVSTDAAVAPGPYPADVLSFARRECDRALESLWGVTRWFWVNHPFAAKRATNKLLQLQLAGGLGFRIPRTLVTTHVASARAFAEQFPSTVAKTLSGGWADVEGTPYALFTRKVSSDELTDDSLGGCPCILQERMPRKLDLRVTVVGSQLFAAAIRQAEPDDEVDWRAADRHRLAYESYELPDGLRTLCFRLLRALDLQYGCFDFIVTPAGDTVFLEINAGGQWGWIEEALGYGITSSLVDLLVNRS